MVATPIRNSPEVPQAMKAGRAAHYGPIDEMLSVEEQVSVPRLTSLDPKRSKNQMLIRTHSVALAPGDVRVLSGKTRELQGPPAVPYIPAGDACGIVVELPEEEDSNGNLPFAVGDRVAVRFCGKNYDALAEYGLVSVNVAAKVPPNLTSIQAAALASAAPAKLLAEYAQPGERVLVVGAGGGVGAHLCQWLRAERKVSYLVGVSRAPDRLKEAPISCNAAIDYTQNNVYTMQEYQKDPFDVIIDLAGGGYSELEECNSNGRPLILKANGRFVTTVPPSGPTFEIHGIWNLMSVFLFPILWKVMRSRLPRSSLPKYSFAFALPETRDHLVDTLQAASEGRIKAVLDSKGPFPFTTQGIRDAFHLQESRHAQGKVVVMVQSEEQ